MTDVEAGPDTDTASAVPPADGQLVRAAVAAGQRIDRAVLTRSITKVAELSAVVLAVAYGLGMAVLAGQLRDLGLHDTSILTGFEHDDVLMKGFGALITHVPTLAMLLLVVGTALNERVRTLVQNVLSPAAERSGAAESWSRGQVSAARVGFAVALVLVLLTSVWWEGTAVLMALVGYLLVAVRVPFLRSPDAILGAGIAGLLVIGVMTTYVHAKPPPDIRITTSDDRVVTGGLLGKGESGEWYVVQYDTDPSDGLDDGQLELVPDKLAIDIKMDEAPDTGSPLLYEVIFGD